MWKKIEQSILQIRQASGAEVIILEDDSYVINASRAALKGNAVVNEKDLNGIHELTELKNNLDKSAPVSLVINGKGVLIKKIPGTGNNSPLQTILPNANPADFYIERLPVKDGEIISIVRKETADRIIKEITAMGYYVLSVSPGFGSVTAITPFLRQGQPQQLESDSLLIDLDATNEITGFSIKDQVNNNKYQAKEYLVANQYIKPSVIFSFAAAAGLLADDLTNPEGINEQALNESRKEYRYYKFFRAAGWALLLFTLALLLINFFIYNYYFSMNKAAAESMQFSTLQDNRYRLLEKEIKRKERFLEKTGWAGTSRTSFYADRIAGLVPGDIQLQSLVIYPAKGNTNESAGLLFKRDTIQVTGRADDAADLGQFMNSLKILPEFREVQVKNYVVKNDNGLFTMEIILE